MPAAVTIADFVQRVEILPPTPPFVLGCWRWKGAKDKHGYGQFKRHRFAHIFAYTTKYGPVPEGLELDHLCRRHDCVNPDHLEAVTHEVNVYRGQTPSARNLRKTHCIHGHPFEGRNLILGGVRPTHRQCRTCKNALWLAAYKAGRLGRCKKPIA